jgi:hypothetical protein
VHSGLAAGQHLARKVAGSASAREEIAVQREEEAEHWLSAGGWHIPPAIRSQRMEESTSLNAEELPDTRTFVQSTRAPSNLSNCNEHPLQFSLSRFEIGGWLV